MSSLEDVKMRLERIAQEMTELIHRYSLSADSALQVIGAARAAIHDRKDYVRFLELSLEGRILADEGERLMRAKEQLGQE